MPTRGGHYTFVWSETCNCRPNGGRRNDVMLSPLINFIRRSITLHFRGPDLVAQRCQDETRKHTSDAKALWGVPFYMSSTIAFAKLMTLSSAHMRSLRCYYNNTFRFRHGGPNGQQYFPAEPVCQDASVNSHILFSAWNPKPQKDRDEFIQLQLHCPNVHLHLAKKN